MRKVTKESGYNRTVSVKGNQVWFSHATLNKPSRTTYELRTGFNFDKVPNEAILRLAGETLLIRWRTAFKDAKEIDDTADGQLVDVLKMLTGRKPRMSKIAQVAKLGGKMTREELAKAIAELQYELEAKDEAAEDEQEEEVDEEEEEENE